MPITELIAASSKTLSLLDRLSLWLLSSIALFLIIFLWVPMFSTLVQPKDLRWIESGAVLFVILSVSKFLSILPGIITHSRARRKALQRFHITQSHQCIWAATRQPDGSIITQISGHFMAKNLTAEPLQLISARLIKPKISREPLQDMVLIREQHSNIYGDAVVSGRVIPGGKALPIMITLTVRGAPRQKDGTLPAIIAVTDEEGTEQKVRGKFKALHPSPHTKT